MVNALKYQKELEHLRVEHKKLETMIVDLMRGKIINQFALQDLKKKKLYIKESISYIESILFNDIVA